MSTNKQHTLSRTSLVPSLRADPPMSAALTRAASSAPTAALDAALVPSMTLIATVFALVAVILADALPTPPRAHPVAPAAAPVPLRVVPIPIGPTTIRRPLSNVSSNGVIVVCRRTPVSMHRCLSATGCSDYQDEHAFPVLAQVAENLMRVGCDCTDEDAD